MARPTPPLDKGTLRPFRIWNADARRLVPHMYYAYSWTAIDACWKGIVWCRPGSAFEVFDITNGKHIATISRDRAGVYSRWVHPHFDAPSPKPKPKQARPRLRLVYRRKEEAA